MTQTRRRLPAADANKPQRHTDVAPSNPLQAHTLKLAEQENGNRPAEEGEKFTVVIPRAFSLTLDDGTVHAYKAGVEEMPEFHVEHWYSKAIGVKKV